MNKLMSELRRLYFRCDQAWPAGETDPALDLVDVNGMVRAMVIDFAKVGDWAAVANMYRAVQDDLDLPAPALSVSGHAGFRLWFSLAAPVLATEAAAFLGALQREYLADIPPANLQCLPVADKVAFPACKRVGLVPALCQETGKWSAFIDPSMGSMFVDAPGLEMAPNLDRQADMLAGLASIEADAFRHAVNVLPGGLASGVAAGRAFAAPAAVVPAGVGALPACSAMLGVGGGFTDPRHFLLAVMNDPSASAHHRIKAAKALLCAVPAEDAGNG